MSTTIQRRTPRTNATANAYRTGLRRGLISARIQLTTPAEIIGTVVTTAIMIVALVLMSQASFAGSPVDLGAMGLPGVIAIGVVFGSTMGIIGVLSMDRTNGTLLRSKSVPGGTTGYLVGEITANMLANIVSAAVMLVVGLILFAGLEFASPLRWLLFVAVLVLGMISTMSIGAVLGALISNPKHMPLVMLPLLVLIGISGIFYPLVALPGWVQGIAQAFPLYWYGVGLRAALLPAAASAVESAGSWRLEWVFIVLAIWAALALAAAPKLLSRMARRESGSTLAARRRDVQQQWGV